MEKLEKYITDERTGLKYKLIGDYYFIAGDDKIEKHRPIGIWGQRQLRYLRQHKRLFYSQLLISGSLNDYLADTNEQAEEMLERLINQMATNEGITEKMKAADQMRWIGAMNNIRNRANEMVMNELIYQKAQCQ